MVDRAALKLAATAISFVSLAGGKAEALEVIGALDEPGAPKAEAAPPESAAKPKEATAAPKRVAKPKAEAQKAKAGKPEGGKRHRASPEEVAKLNDDVLATVKQLGGRVGLRQVMTQVKGQSRAAVGRALSLLVDRGLLKREGDRRSTVYWTP